MRLSAIWQKGHERRKSPAYPAQCCLALVTSVGRLTVSVIPFRAVVAFIDDLVLVLLLAE